MKGALLVIVLIAMLVVSVLVWKNLSTHRGPGGDSKTTETVKKAEDAADAAKKALEGMKTD